MTDLIEHATREPAATPVVPEPGETLADAAWRALRHDIICARRAPGERLRIERLRRIYRVGPTPIREALQKLSAEGLVLGEGNRGFAVAPLDPHEFRDLNCARTEIELAALRLSMAAGDAEWEARVVAASYLLDKADAGLGAAELGVPDTWEEANAAYHTALVSACGSDWLLRLRGGLQDLCERYRRASVGRRRGVRQLNREHAEITEAVLARETEKACALLRRHFETTARDLSRGLQ